MESIGTVTMGLVQQRSKFQIRDRLKMNQCIQNLSRLHKKIEKSFYIPIEGQKTELEILERAKVRRSFITTTVRDESQVTPQGRHR